MANKKDFRPGRRKTDKLWGDDEKISEKKESTAGWNNPNFSTLNTSLANDQPEDQVLPKKASISAM